MGPGSVAPTITRKARAFAYCSPQSQSLYAAWVPKVGGFPPPKARAFAYCSPSLGEVQPGGVSSTQRSITFRPAHCANRTTKAKGLVDSSCRGSCYPLSLWQHPK